MPVMTVNERKIVEKTRPCVIRPSQKLLKTNRLRSEPMTTKATPSDHVSTVNTWVRSVAAGAGGGGSTPANGSVASRRWRRLGRNTRRRKRATKGSEGRRPRATMLSGGR